MRRSLVDVKGVLTRFIAIDASKESKRIVLVIPGNPGVASFYEEFIQHVYDRMSGAVSVWTVGHPGHEMHDQMPTLSANASKLDLRGQIQHKIDFVDSFVPTGSDLTLVGHSIGCKMSLDVMAHFEQSSSEKFSRLRAYFLFPTIERMYETPNGRWVWWQVHYAPQLISCAAEALRQLVPKALLSRLVSWYVGCDHAEEDSKTHPMVASVLALLGYTSVRNALFLAKTELLTVKEIDAPAVKMLANRIRFLFGASDGWCPLYFLDDLRELLGPVLQAHVGEPHVAHAFVIKSSAHVAGVVADWLRADAAHPCCCLATCHLCTAVGNEDSAQRHCSRRKTAAS